MRRVVVIVIIIFIKGADKTARGDENLREGRIPLPPPTEKPPTAVLVVEGRSTKKAGGMRYPHIQSVNVKEQAGMYG